MVVFGSKGSLWAGHPWGQAFKRGWLFGDHREGLGFIWEARKV